MQQWRSDFGVPNAFFGIVQLSTWCPTPARGTPDALAQLRVSQVASLAHPSDACKFGVPPPHKKKTSTHPKAALAP